MKKLIALLVVITPLSVLADAVIPGDKVENNVNIRLSPDSSSEIVGRLNKGESLTLVGTDDGWHEVELEGGATGYISADWTKVVDEDAVVEAPPAPAEPEASPEPAPVVEDVVAEEAPMADEAPELVSEPEPDPVAEVVVQPELAAEPEVEVVVESAPEPEPEPEPEAARDAAPSALKGSKNFVVRFRNETEGGNSQIYDDGNRIGIGTTEPQQRLEVNGSIQIHEQNSSVAGLMITQSSGDTGYIMHNRASTLTIGAGSQDRITIDRNGNVGIGVSRPKNPLEMASGAHVTAGGVWSNSSSRDRKENIAVLGASDAMDAFNELAPVVYNYKSESGEQYVGFIAEDVPELVAMQDRESLSTMDIVAVLTRVVQEQQRRIDELEARLDAADR